MIRFLHLSELHAHKVLHLSPDCLQTHFLIQWLLQLHNLYELIDEFSLFEGVKSILLSIDFRTL